MTISTPTPTIPALDTMHESLAPLRYAGDPAGFSWETKAKAGEYASWCRQLGLVAALHRHEAGEGRAVVAELMGQATKLIEAGGHAHLDGSGMRGDRVLTARTLFQRHGSEISAALLLGALPQAYAASHGARVLAEAKGLESDLTRRIRSTAQFLVWVLLEDRDDKAPRNPWTRHTLRVDACLGLRLFHEAIRTMIGKPASGTDTEMPINQEDLLGTLLTFVVTVFEVLESFGIGWTEEEQRGYLGFWNVIGTLLGISGVPGLHGQQPSLPETVEEARHVLAHIRDRNWITPDDLATSSTSGEPADADDSQPGWRTTKANVKLGAASDEWNALRDGRLLLRALLTELEGAMPARYRRWPASVIRQLAEARVCDILGLGGPGLVPLVLREVRPPGDRVGFTEYPRVSPVGAALLRFQANVVVRHAMLHFLEDQKDRPTFWIPGLEEWSGGFG